MTVPAVTLPDPAIVENVLIRGDLAALNTQQRIDYLLKVCEVCGLNPLTQPFAYIRLSGKDVLYATKSCGEQLRMLHNISVEDVSSRTDSDTYIVTTKVRLVNGRTDASIGAVAIGNLRGEARANAMMKAETKSKRRATLSICGLGFLLDESELPDEVFQRTPAPPAPNVILPPPPTATPSRTAVADAPREMPPSRGDGEPAPPESPLPDGAGTDESALLLHHDALLDKAAATGDKGRLEAAWRLVPDDLKPTLRGGLERRHWPKLQAVSNA